eukprot:760593-Hanusia_phi.AAC.8
MEPFIYQIRGRLSQQLGERLVTVRTMIKRQRPRPTHAPQKPLEDRTVTAGPSPGVRRCIRSDHQPGRTVRPPAGPARPRLLAMTLWQSKQMKP